MTDLPISGHLEEIKEGLRSGAALVLEAPPGAGKTTLVPLALLNEPWVQGRKIIVLEPRRLAAKAAARRMASILGERVGSTVGYRVRRDTCVSKSTRIEVITEGILTRMLIEDTDLSDVACVIFDEFHERSLHADIGLGLTLLSAELSRADLRIVVMSATLSALDLGRLLPTATTIVSRGRTYPITDVWMRSKDDRPLPTLVAAAVSDALAEAHGDVLVFLPGVAEIKRCQEALRGVNAAVLPLFGDLPPADQDQILSAPMKGASPRVILATSVAETSITIPGITTVIDSGLSREPRFDPRSGLTRLVTVPVSVDSAEQRRGRAGRTAAGTCIHLWTEAEHAERPASRTPEILTADLVPLVIALAAFGATASDVRWLTEPPTSHLDQAAELLRHLQMLDANGTLTEHGRAASAMGTHPRLAHMILASRDAGLEDLALQVASIVEEQRRPAGASAELHVPSAGPHDVGHCLALAFPDRLAQRRSENRFVLRNGRTVRLNDHDPLARSTWLAVASVGGGTEAWIGLAAPVTEAIVRTVFAGEIELRVTAGWDERLQQMVAIEDEHLGAIVLQTRPARSVDPLHLAEQFAQVLARREYRDLPWTAKTEHLRDRIAFVRYHSRGTGDDTAGDPLPPSALAPHLIGMRKLTDLKALNLGEVLDSAVPWHERGKLDHVAPVEWTTPSGRAIRIDYSDPEQPRLSVRLQQMFGVLKTPTVGEGRIPLTIELLSPANRPIQITKDLAGFWAGSYAQVRKEMKGRYPKHDWPERPEDRIGK